MAIVIPSKRIYEKENDKTKQNRILQVNKNTAKQSTQYSELLNENIVYYERKTDVKEVSSAPPSHFTSEDQANGYSTDILYKHGNDYYEVNLGIGQYGGCQNIGYFEVLSDTSENFYDKIAYATARTPYIGKNTQGESIYEDGKGIIDTLVQSAGRIYAGGNCVFADPQLVIPKDVQIGDIVLCKYTIDDYRPKSERFIYTDLTDGIDKRLTNWASILQSEARQQLFKTFDLVPSTATMWCYVDEKASEDDEVGKKHTRYYIERNSGSSVIIAPFGTSGTSTEQYNYSEYKIERTRFYDTTGSTINVSINSDIPSKKISMTAGSTMYSLATNKQYCFDVIQSKQEFYNIFFYGRTPQQIGITVLAVNPNIDGAFALVDDGEELTLLALLKTVKTHDNNFMACSDVSFDLKVKELVINRIEQETNDSNSYSIKDSNFNVSGNQRLASDLSTLILNEYSDGKEVAEIRCSINDYYDTGGNKVIDISNNDKMTFSVGDIVIPYRNVPNISQEQPISYYKNGQPKQFLVTGVGIEFDGALWQKLQLQEVKSNT